MKRAREKTRVVPPYLSHHDSPHEHASFIREYIQKVPNERRESAALVLKQGWNLRCFVGFMPGKIVRKQEKLLCKQSGPYQYFIYFSAGEPGKATLSFICMNEWGEKRSRRHCAASIAEINDYLCTYQAETGHRLNPMDRGLCIMYSSHTNNLAKKAIEHWCLCATKLCLPKDIRRYIGQLLWTLRYTWMP